MITANELRVGNWVIANGLHEGKVLTVEQIGEKGSLSDGNRVILFKQSRVGEFCKDLEPINITPEILEKAGFIYDSTQDKDGISFWDIQINERVFSLGQWGGDYYFIDVFIGGHYKTPIKCLHQLQNLYYALTLTELEINMM